MGGTHYEFQGDRRKSIPDGRFDLVNLKSARLRKIGQKHFPSDRVLIRLKDKSGNVFNSGKRFGKKTSHNFNLIDHSERLVLPCRIKNAGRNLADLRNKAAFVAGAGGVFAGTPDPARCIGKSWGDAMPSVCRRPCPSRNCHRNLLAPF